MGSARVTEDADLGIRLHRAGYRTLVLDSTTYEEANSDFVNWVKQRSRWYKGYMQTWLVHMRNPRRLYRQLGLRGFIGFNLFLGGTPILALLNPVFWVLTVTWFVARPEIVEAMFPFWVYYAGLFCMVFGNLVFLYLSMVSARESGWPNLVFAALLSPMYWAMMSLAAVKALVQLIDGPPSGRRQSMGWTNPPPDPQIDPAMLSADVRVLGEGPVARAAADSPSRISAGTAVFLSAFLLDATLAALLVFGERIIVRMPGAAWRMRTHALQPGPTLAALGPSGRRFRHWPSCPSCRSAPSGQTSLIVRSPAI